MKRKEAMALIEARGGYRNLPSGYCDETDLLILSSIEREPKKCKGSAKKGKLKRGSKPSSK